METKEQRDARRDPRKTAAANGMVANQRTWELLAKLRLQDKHQTRRMKKQEKKPETEVPVHIENKVQ